jgi:hypothetical protein
MLLKVDQLTSYSFKLGISEHKLETKHFLNERGFYEKDYFNLSPDLFVRLYQKI